MEEIFFFWLPPPLKTKKKAPFFFFQKLFLFPSKAKKRAKKIPGPGPPFWGGEKEKN